MKNKFSALLRITTNQVHIVYDILYPVVKIPLLSLFDASLQTLPPLLDEPISPPPHSLDLRLQVLFLLLLGQFRSLHSLIIRTNRRVEPPAQRSVHGLGGGGGKWKWKIYETKKKPKSTIQISISFMPTLNISPDCRNSISSWARRC